MKPQAVQILMPRGIIPGTRVVGALTSWIFGISIDIQADCAWHGWGRHTNEPLIGRRCPNSLSNSEVMPSTDMEIENSTLAQPQGPP